MASRLQDKRQMRFGAGPSLAVWAAGVTGVAIGGIAIFGRYDPADPLVLLAIGAAFALGLVLIAVSLIAHLLESRDLAQLGVLLDRAEAGHRDALDESERIMAELGIADDADGSSPRA